MIYTIYQGILEEPCEETTSHFTHDNLVLFQKLKIKAIHEKLEEQVQINCTLLNTDNHWEKKLELLQAK